MRWLLYLVIGVCLFAITYSGIKIFGIQAEYNKGDALYDQLRKNLEEEGGSLGSMSPDEADREGVSNNTIGAAIPDVSAMPASTNQGDAFSQGEFNPFDADGIYMGNDGEAPPPIDKPQMQIEDAKAKSPDAVDTLPSKMNFDKLREMNPDTVAWINMNDGTIDYPVVQGKDNKFYLNHLFSREYGKAGSIFMEVTNAADFSDKNTLLFGHHMNNGSMFANIENYRNQAYYELFPRMELYTPQGDNKVEWFAGYPVSAARIPTAFDSSEAFLAHVEKARSRSDFQAAEVQVSAEDRLVTLVTCTYAWENARYILVGVIRGE